MLVNSNRFKDGDIEHFQELEKLDLMHYESNQEKMNKIENESMDYIKKFSENKNCFIGVSWGKDSMVCLDLIVRLKLNIPVIHFREYKIENPETYSVRDLFLKKNDIDYKEILIDTEYFHQDKYFIKKVNEHNKNYSGRITGIRMQESATRKISGLVHGVNTENVCRPILSWSNQQVFSYLVYYNLLIHPNYGMSNNGFFKRDRLRVDSLTGFGGNGGGRKEWEEMYYSDVLRRIQKNSLTKFNHNLI